MGIRRKIDYGAPPERDRVPSSLGTGSKFFADEHELRAGVNLTFLL